MAKVTLTPDPVDISSPIFTALSQWTYADPFEAAFVNRILANDIPQRVKFHNGAVWTYTDPQKNVVAFGTLSICDDYASLTDGIMHSYIPLLAVHPHHRGQGYGRTVIEHLIDEAACVAKAHAGLVHHALFLDVYDKSEAARGLYCKCGFYDLGGLRVDPLNGEQYYVMARRVAP